MKEDTRRSRKCTKKGLLNVHFGPNSTGFNEIAACRQLTQFRKIEKSAWPPDVEEEEDEGEISWEYLTWSIEVPWKVITDDKRHR